MKKLRWERIRKGLYNDSTNKWQIRYDDVTNEYSFDGKWKLLDISGVIEDCVGRFKTLKEAKNSAHNS